jgi:hypothetical protein
MHIQHLTAVEVTVNETMYNALGLEWKLQNKTVLAKLLYILNGWANNSLLSWSTKVINMWKFMESNIGRKSCTIYPITLNKCSLYKIFVWKFLSPMLTSLMLLTNFHNALILKGMLTIKWTWSMTLLPIHYLPTSSSIWANMSHMIIMKESDLNSAANHTAIHVRTHSTF